MKKLVASLFALAVALGCGTEQSADPGPLGQQASAEVLQGTILPRETDLATPPSGSLDFHVDYDYSSGEPRVRDWLETARGPLYAGSSVRVSVAEQRFPSCGTWGTVTASARLPDGRILEAALSEGEPGSLRWGELALPGGIDGLELWLRAENGGCVEYDSDFGRNYRFEIAEWSPTAIRFGADWGEQAEGTLRKGGALVVDYDIARLPNCRVVYRGFPSWTVKAWVRFDDGTLYVQRLVEFRYGEQGTPDGGWASKLAVFPIPRAANAVELWFENDQYPPTCHEWDSNYGSNYRFEVR